MAAWYTPNNLRIVDIDAVRYRVVALQRFMWAKVVYGDRLFSETSNVVYLVFWDLVLTRRSLVPDVIINHRRGTMYYNSIEWQYKDSLPATSAALYPTTHVVFYTDLYGPVVLDMYFMS